MLKSSKLAYDRKYMLKKEKIEATMGNKVLFLFLLLIISLQQTVCQEESCGRSLEKFLQTRVVGGYSVGYFKYPWIGILEINGKITCHCSMINNRFALTAASCFRNYISTPANESLTPSFTVVFGYCNPCKECGPIRKPVQVARVFINENFVKGQRSNNIALIELVEDSGVEPICLPPKPLDADSRPSEGIIAGIGTTTYPPQRVECKLHVGRVLIYDNDRCADQLRNVGEDPAILDKTFCAGGMNETKPYGCGIDLGGPLMVSDYHTTLYILGIVTYKKCSENENITLYQDVSKHLDWIYSIVGGVSTTTPVTTSPNPGNDDYDDLYGDYDAQSSPSGSEATDTPSSTFSPIIIGPSGKHGGHKRVHSKEGHKRNGHKQNQHKAHKNHVENKLEDGHEDRHHKHGNQHRSGHQDEHRKGHHENEHGKEHY